MRLEFSPELIYEWEVWIEDWFFVLAMGVFLLEILWLGVNKRLSKDFLFDTTSNFITLAAHITIVALTAGAWVVSHYFVAWYIAPISIPITYGSIIACIILADLAYYWEHRAAHRLGIGWATHSVHHSSEHFNISVAYRHGPFDAFFGVPFHLPLALIGFDPILIFASAAMVQLYQALLHTEMVGKLPRPIEAIFNTPSHHRVHHGSNEQYIDKNYAGILIIWDRMFGSFEVENEKVVYGLLTPLETNNPVVVFGHGIQRLLAKSHAQTGIKNKLLAFWKPPGWNPAAE